MASFQAKIGWKRKKVKIIIPISSSLTCNREFQKNSKKKKKKNHYGFFSSQNRLGKAKKIENENYRSDQFLPNSIQRIPKIISENYKKLKSTTMASLPAKTG